MTISQYSITSSCSDTAFIYDAYSDSFKTPLPSFVTFNPATRQFTFNSLVDSDMGNHQIAVFATLTNAQVDISYFTLAVKSPCELGLWTHPSVSDVTYILGETTMAITFPPATLSKTGCTISYNMGMRTSASSPYSTLTP
jgi:hypothetical protein